MSKVISYLHKKKEETRNLTGWKPSSLNRSGYDSESMELAEERDFVPFHMERDNMNKLIGSGSPD